MKQQRLQDRIAHMLLYNYTTADSKQRQLFAKQKDALASLAKQIYRYWSPIGEAQRMFE